MEVLEAKKRKCIVQGAEINVATLDQSDMEEEDEENLIAEHNLFLMAGPGLRAGRT